MKLSLLAVAIGLGFSLLGCSKVQTPVPTNANQSSHSAQVSQQLSPEARYLALVDNYFKDYLKLEPIFATFVGVNEYNAQFGGDLTEGYLKARHELNRRYLAEVKGIDVAQ
ncbi:MAG: DUF885 domain-containing protein, partial [Shewanella sp.]